jgi:hypothetical protein
LYSPGSIKRDVRQASGDTGNFVGMYCFLMIRRMIHIIYRRVESGVVIEDDVLSHRRALL